MNTHPHLLLEFFSAQAPAETEAALAEAVERGLAAARMLVAIHDIIGAHPAPSGEESDGMAEALADADRLLLENMELRKENEALRERMTWLQRQVERLHNKKEMKSILERIEKSPDEPESNAKVQEALKEEMEVEAAARAPREEKSAEGEAKPAEAGTPAGEAAPPA